MGKVVVIVAVSKNGGIGRNNDLLFHLPDDMRFFKETTSGHIVITGRKNFESIPERFRPLPNRLNVVISRNPAYDSGCEVRTDLNECISALRPDDRTIFIIGGGQIYREALRLGLVDEIILTHVDTEAEADTFFPLEVIAGLSGELVLKKESDDKHAFGFEIKKYVLKH